MNEKHLADAIVAACIDMDGFLIQLRTTSGFHEAHYDQLVALLRAYRDVLADSRVMDRRVAGCLFALEQQLLIQIDRHRNAPYPTPGKQRIDYAFNEITELTSAILWQ